MHFTNDCIIIIIIIISNHRDNGRNDKRHCVDKALHLHSASLGSRHVALSPATSQQQRPAKTVLVLYRTLTQHVGMSVPL